jgi:predicted RNase H-like HicB family nuclease
VIEKIIKPWRPAFRRSSSWWGGCRSFRYHLIVTFTVEFDREEDGRWIGLIEAVPGCHVYGATREAALAKVEALALHVVAERLEDGEISAEEAASVNFVVSAAA